MTINRIPIFEQRPKIIKDSGFVSIRQPNCKLETIDFENLSQTPANLEIESFDLFKFSRNPSTGGTK